MRNDGKDKWYFTKMPTRPTLSAEEVVYWRALLKKVLKVGLEFEFNLPEKKSGSCKGDSNTCPCSHLIMDNECWQKCLNSEVCEAFIKSKATCRHDYLVECKSKNCEDCKNFKSICAGITCSNFVSSCFSCQNFEINCDDCKYKFDPNKNPETIRNIFQEELKPNNSYGTIGDHGVHSITTDGSLSGGKGAEIITVGRRLDYWEFHKMTSKILALAKRRGAYMNERCSIHMHVLAGYYGKVVPNQEKTAIPIKVSELERDMPEIILANLHQLVRRYQNAMTWMVMGLDEPNRITRWEKFRVSVLPVSALTLHMRNVREEVSRLAGKNKYGWINYSQVEFAKNGNVSRLHVEFRAADGIMSPSAVAAIACMYYALIIKAVEISRFGIVEVCDQGWLEQTHKVKKALLNNMKDYGDGDRFGDTRELHKYYDILIRESLDLVRQLKSILIKVGPAYEVLEKLAEKPTALRRCDGQTWEQIENDLKIIVGEEGQFEIVMAEIVTLNHVAECKDLEEWVEGVGQVLRNDPTLQIDEDNAIIEDNIRDFVKRNTDDGRLIWSNSIGAPIML